MEGLHFRKREKQTNKEDEAEFLDEEEQEQLIKELREQNDTANVNIQRGLIIIGLVVSSLFFNILIQNNPPIIPITHIFEPQETVLKVPKIAAIFSIVSIFTSIFSLILSSQVVLIKFIKTDTIKRSIRLKHAVIGAASFGSISPIMSLLHHSSSTELLFWLIPSILMFMYYFAYSMILQVYQGLEELEGSKYKYKGA